MIQNMKANLPVLTSLAIVALTLAAPTSPAADTAAKKPNILFIAVDDLRPELGCYGKDYIKSPNIDRIAKAGMVFNRAYCQQAVCSPTRSSLMTGTRPDTTKVWDLVTHFRDALPEVVTLGQHFKQNGYFVQGMGKIYHGSLDDPATWSVPWQTPKAVKYALAENVKLDQRQFEGEPDGDAKPKAKKKKGKSDSAPDGPPSTGPNSRGPAFEGADVPDNTFQDGKVAELALSTLRDLSQKKEPFFLAVGFIRPHTSWVAPTEFFDHITPTNAISMPYYFVPGGEDISTNNVPALAVPGNGNAFAHTPPTLGQVREARRAYMAAAAFSDSQLGRVMARLDELNLATNTIVVVTGDNGYCLGEHNRWSKPSLFDVGLRVPLIIRAPGYASGVCTGMVEQVDIYPTLAALAGLPISTNVQGMSLQPHLANPALPAKSACFSTFLSSGVLGHSVTTDRYIYVKWGAGTNGITWGTTLHQFYDHATDPLELTNLANVPAYSNLVVQLHTQLTNHVVTAGGE